jgi:hypothetical protein
MRQIRCISQLLLLFAVAIATAAPASATTLLRQSLDELVANHSTIVVAEVVDAHSYWKEDGSFIVTDFRVEASEVLKGNARKRELTVTVLGGTVGDLTTLIPGGADYAVGKQYVMFLADRPLPGSSGELTAPSHSQGVFEIVRARDGYRAISQAKAEHLVPDALGFVDPPGGATGVLLEEMTATIRELAKSQSQEVKP